MGLGFGRPGGFSQLTGPFASRAGQDSEFLKSTVEQPLPGVGCRADKVWRPRSCHCALRNSTEKLTAAAVPHRAHSGRRAAGPRGLRSAATVRCRSLSLIGPSDRTVSAPGPGQTRRPRRRRPAAVAAGTVPRTPGPGDRRADACRTVGTVPSLSYDTPVPGDGTPVTGTVPGRDYRTPASGESSRARPGAARRQAAADPD
eukprot:768471-Hanusia_phi.AAC.6